MDVDAEEALSKQSVDESMEWVELVPTLEQALATLSEEARTVVWLHDVEGYTHKEIGELMGKTASFSKSQLARAYEKLLLWQQQRETKQAERIRAQQKNELEGPNAKTTLGNIGSHCVT
jgi:DNA-directed RNA polymerase specialized sigma24 family protein